MGSVWIRRRQSCNRRGEQWRGAALKPTTDKVVSPARHWHQIPEHDLHILLAPLADGWLFILGCRRHIMNNYPCMNYEMEWFELVMNLITSSNLLAFATVLPAGCSWPRLKKYWVWGLLLFMIHWTCQAVHTLDLSKQVRHNRPWSSTASLTLKSALTQQVERLRRCIAPPCHFHIFSSMLNIFHF